MLPSTKAHANVFASLHARIDIFSNTTPAICKADNITNDVKGRAPCVPSCFCANTQESGLSSVGIERAKSLC
jgi:hypothetical protein